MSVEDFLNEEFLVKGPFWHLCTPGDLSGVLFREEKDFVYGMNLVAHAAVFHWGKVVIYTFVLMNNHLHFVLSGAEEDCMEFFSFIARRLKRYLGLQDRVFDFKGFGCKLFKIDDLQYLRNVIAYINRNAYVASRSYTPYAYFWGVGYCFFNCAMDFVVGKPLKDFTVRELRSMFFTRNVAFPSGFRFVRGYVSPDCYCNVRGAEQFFRNPNQYFNLVSRQVESFVSIARELGDRVTYTDDEIYSVAISSALKDFDVRKVSDLDSEQKISLAKKLHFGYNASNKQIKRVLRLDEVVVDGLFPQSRRPDF